MAEDGPQQLDELKQAATLAAASAAVGVAVGAARALLERGSEDGRKAEAEPAPEPEAASEPEVEAEEISTAPESAVEDEQEQDEPEEDHRTPRSELRSASAESANSIIRRARRQLEELQGSDAESVSSLERTGDGWTVVLEVVELARVPESTDVMASYEMLLDDDGDLMRYARTRRYYRSQADSER
jgi:hypothetical protein